MSKLNRRIRENETEKHADDFSQYAKTEHITACSIARMGVVALYYFVDKAVPQKTQNFNDFVFLPLGEAEESYLQPFSAIRQHISAIVAEAEMEAESLAADPADEWDAMNEAHEFGKMQALAGWHHVTATA